MKINPREKPTSAATLVEYLVAAGVSGILMLALVPLTMYSAWNFATLANYSDLNTTSLQALDQITTEVRRAVKVQSFSPTQVTLDMGTNQPALSYAFSPITQTLTKQQGANSKVLLRGVTNLEFAMFKRNPKPGVFEHYSATNVSDCKVLTLKWDAARQIMGSQISSESVQAARIVIRKN